MVTRFHSMNRHRDLGVWKLAKELVLREIDAVLVQRIEILRAEIIRGIFTILRRGGRWQTN
jgi:hypothetical protein